MRSYLPKDHPDKKKEIGLEEDFNEYINRLAQIFTEIKRVLKKPGSFYLNIGDTYGGAQGKNAGWPDSLTKAEIPWMKKPKQFAKCLLCMPERLMLVLIEKGWILRNKIIWHKCLAGTQSIYAKSQGRLLRATIRELYRLPKRKLELPGKDGWRKIKSFKRLRKQELLVIHLRDGSKIKVTKEHRFLIKGKLIQAGHLKVGDILDKQNNLLHTSSSLFGSYEIGWMAGLFLAEGNYERSRKGIRFSLNTTTKLKFADRLKVLADKFGARFRKHMYGNSMVVILSGEVITAVIKQYINGEGSLKKHFSRQVWNESIDFIKGVIEGWLDGDGSYDKKNNRWKLGFGFNEELEEDLRAACAILGWSFKARHARAKYQGNNIKPCIRGELKKFKTIHFNNKANTQVIKITKTAGTPYEIEVDGDHLFTLTNGVITHNSNHMPGSQKDRLTCSWEYVYHFVKNNKGSDWYILGNEPNLEKYPQKHKLWLSVPEELRHNCWHKERIPKKFLSAFMRLDYYYDLDIIREKHKSTSLERYHRGYGSPDNKLQQAGMQLPLPPKDWREKNKEQGRPAKPPKGVNLGGGQTGLARRPESPPHGTKNQHKGIWNLNKFEREQLLRQQKEQHDPFGHQNPHRKGRDYKDPQKSAEAKKKWYRHDKRNKSRVEANVEHFKEKGQGGHYLFGGLDSPQASHENVKGKNPGDVIKAKGENRIYSGRYGNDGKGMMMPKKYNNPKGKIPQDTIRTDDRAQTAKKENMHTFYAHSKRGKQYENPLGKNPDDVLPDDFLTLTTMGFKEAHFAVFPPSLLIRPILSSCPKEGVILDPFSGAGTTALVAKVLSRNYIGIDINKEYNLMAQRRINNPNEQKKVWEAIKKKYPEIYERVCPENDLFKTKV